MQLNLAQREGPAAAEPTMRPLSLSLRHPKSTFFHARAKISIAIRNASCQSMCAGFLPGFYPNLGFHCSPKRHLL